MYRAYGEVFHVRYEDRDDAYFPLSKKELEKLPKLIAEVRKIHGVAASSEASPPEQKASAWEAASKNYWGARDIDSWARDVRMYQDTRNQDGLDSIFREVPAYALAALNERVAQQNDAIAQAAKTKADPSSKVKSFWDTNDIDDYARGIRDYEESRNYEGLNYLWKQVPVEEIDTLKQRIRQQNHDQAQAQYEFARDVEEATIVRGLFKDQVRNASDTLTIFKSQDIVRDLIDQVRKKLDAAGDNSNVTTYDLAKSAYDAFMNRDVVAPNIDEIALAAKTRADKRTGSLPPEPPGKGFTPPPPAPG